MKGTYNIGIEYPFEQVIHVVRAECKIVCVFQSTDVVIHGNVVSTS